jgi:hypothetical protein
MKAVKVMATINEQGQLTLDHPLITDKNSRVEVIILIPEKGLPFAAQSIAALLKRL